MSISSNKVLPLDSDPDRPEEAVPGDQDVEKGQLSAVDLPPQDGGGDQDTQNQEEGVAEEGNPEDADGDQSSLTKEQTLTPATTEPPRPILIWWGDLVPKEDGTIRKVVRYSDVEFAEDRGQWSHVAEFILSCMGMSVGLGNVWRFPYLAYKNGGAAFLVAYIILQLLVGKAMYFMELTLTQFSGKGPTKMWDMFPAAKGIGFSMCLISINIALYYNVVMCYCIYYFVCSFFPTPPWTVCLDEWTNCVEERFPSCTFDWKADDGNCACTGNDTIDKAVPVDCVRQLKNASTAASFFFYKSVIERSPGLEPENIGAPLWKLTICLFICWVIVVTCLWKGIKSSGKVVYFTVTFPYAMLVALLLRNFFLEGALDGMLYFLVPTWSKMKNIQVWGEAAGQMFFSLSVTLGGIIMFGSYNRFDYPVYQGALIVATMDLVTSVIGGLVVFTTFGAMAKKIGATVQDIAISGYGLAFVIYPEALSRMPLTQLWSIIFFLMLFTLGLDSEFGLCETCLTSIYDELPWIRRHKGKACLVMGLVGFSLALPCLCPGGDYVVTLMDHYGADIAVIFIALCEIMSIMYGYGAYNVMKDLEYMLGGRPHLWQYWIFCWVFSAPLILAFIFVQRIVHYKPPHYGTGEPFPVFAQVIGWLLFSAIIGPVPIYFAYLVIKSFKKAGGIDTWEKRKKFLFSPNRNWMPNDGRADQVLV